MSFAGERSRSGGRLALRRELTLAQSLLSWGSGVKVFVGVAVSLGLNVGENVLSLLGLCAGNGVDSKSLALRVSVRRQNIRAHNILETAVAYCVHCDLSLVPAL